MTTATVLHAYGLVRPRGELVLPPAGIGGAPVTLVEVGQLAALASELDEDRHGPDVWRTHAEDPRWLGEVAAEHNAVLESVVDQTDVLPLRLPGLYGDRVALEQVLREQADAFERVLSAVQGHVEWGVKVFLVREVDDADAAEQPRSGRDYLMRKASETNRREAAREQRTASLLDAHAALSDVATHAVVNAPHDGALSGRAEPMLLNAAYLVGRGSRDTFLEVAQRCGDRLWDDGMSLEVTGPWPPYNFAQGAEGDRAGERS